MLFHQFTSKVILTLILLSISLVAVGQQELPKLGQVTFTGNVNDIWAYVDDAANEYAIVGTQSGVSIVDVTVPTEAKELFYIGGEVSTWRDIKTYEHYAYINNETKGGLLIIDLSELPEKIDTFSFIDRGKINKSHNLYIDEAGFLYVAGFTNLQNSLIVNNRGVMIYDLKDDPTSPTFKGAYFDGYAHDVFVRDDIMYTSEVYNGWLGIIDVRNRAKPTRMATVETPLQFTHNAWLSDNGTHIFTTDEKQGAFTTAYDIRDLNDITEVDRYQSTPGGSVVPHNAHVHNDFLVISHYTDGVRIVDANEPDALVETAFYDTTDADSIAFQGCWGAYPFLPSGNLLATDRANGLFILDAVYQRAAYIGGTVIDAENGQPIFAANLQLSNSDQQKKTNLFGKYKVGIAEEGNYDLLINKYGYFAKKIEGIALKSGQVTSLDITLEKQASFPLTVKVIDAITGAPINNAVVDIENSVAAYQVVENETGIYSVIDEAYEDEYKLLVTAWGYHPKNQVMELNNDQYEIIVEMEAGYYDDFRTDLGWRLAGDAHPNGEWIRAIPIPTYDNSGEITYAANPGADVDTDEGDYCYMTGNYPGFADNADLDEAITAITSPIFDLSDKPDAVISFYLWFYSSDFEENTDNVTFNILNGEDQVRVQRIDSYNAQRSQWLYFEFRPSDFLPLTDSMRLSIHAIATFPDFKVTEMAFDAFEIREEKQTATPSLDPNNYHLNAQPSLFAQTTVLELQQKNASHSQQPIQLEVYNLQGQLISQQTTFSNTPIIWGAGVPSGYYLVKMGNAQEGFLTRKIVKY